MDLEATACSSSVLQRLRAFRRYVHVVDVGHWGANYLLWFEDQLEATRAKVVVVDDGPGLQLYWLWSESGKVSLPNSDPPSSTRPEHLACIQRHLPAGAVLGTVIFLGWYREVVFEEVIPQDAPPCVDTLRSVLATIGRLPTNRGLDGIAVCVPHESPFWERAPRHTRLGKTFDVSGVTSTGEEAPYWVELPALTPVSGASILQAALKWASSHPHLPSGILETLLTSARNRLENKPPPTLDVLHAADAGSLLPPRLAQRVEVALLARVEFQDTQVVSRLEVALGVNELLLGARGRSTIVLAGVPISAELTASPAAPRAEGIGRRTLAFSLELTVCVAYVTSTQRLSMLGEFLIDEDRIALCSLTQRGGATMQSFYRCSDPTRTPAVECAIVSVQTVLG